MSKIVSGDCFEIPLPDGRLAYCQVMLQHEQMGHMVRVLDRIDTARVLSIDELLAARDLFPPVFVSIRARRWRRVGRLPVRPFEFPRFRHFLGSGAGTYLNWRLWDGKTYEFVGALPPALRCLEVDVLWTDVALEARIATGVSGFEEVQ